MIAARVLKRASVDLAIVAVRVGSIARGLRKAALVWIGSAAPGSFRARAVTIWRSRCLLPQVEPFNVPIIPAGPTTSERPSTDIPAELEYSG